MGQYATFEDIKAEGAVRPTHTRNFVEGRIAKWESVVEMKTRNVFYEVSPGELIFEGSGGPYLLFDIPILTFTSLKLNGNTVALDSSYYRVHNGATPVKDDRQNPKIEILRNVNRNIFVGTVDPFFLQGYDQAVTATWGYLDPPPPPPPGPPPPGPLPVGQCPALIRDAVIQLTVLDLDGYFKKWESGGTKALAPVRRERTDDHEVEFSTPAIGNARFSDLIPGDLLEQIMMFRAPMAIDAPVSPLVVPTTIDLYGV